jgi:hypothetical protein
MERLSISLVWILLQWISVALFFIGYRRTMRLMRFFSSARSSELRLGRLRKLRRRVERASCLWPVEEGDCLRRSMALWWLLQREGISSTIVTGVRKADGSYSFHAWVEISGAVVNDSPSAVSAYKRLENGMDPNYMD